MITALELAIAGFLTAKLAAISPAIPAHQVRAATNKLQPPGDRSLVIVRCEDSPHQGGGLHLCSIQILVSSPADVATVTVETHMAVDNAINKVLQEDPDQAGFNQAVADGVTGKKGGNYFADGWRPGIEATSWQPYYSITAGVLNA